MDMKAPPQTSHTYQVRAQVDGQTELALKSEQGRIQQQTGKRPRMEEVIANVLQNWAKDQQPVG